MLKSRKHINKQKTTLRSMQITKSKLLGLLIATILLTSLICYVAFSNPDLSYTTVIQEGSMNIGASYIIFKDGSNYYARNGITGAIQFSGTDAATVIQNSLDTFGNYTGGKVHLKTGIYNISKTILVRGNTIFEGEGMMGDHPDFTNQIGATTLWLNDNVNADVIRVNATWSNPATYSYQSTIIRDLGIYGNNASQTAGNGIRIWACYFINVYNVRIQRVWDCGIAINGTGAQETAVNHGVIANNIIRQNRNGIYIGAYCSDIIVSQNYINVNMDYGVYVANGRNNNIINNELLGYAGVGNYGVYIGGDWSMRNSITGNVISGFAVNGVCIGSGVDHTIILGNQLRTDSGTSFSDGGSGTIMVHNQNGTL